MSVWPGWQGDILDAANLPNNQPARNFLADWHTHQGGNCQDNPLMASRKASGSTDCVTLPGGHHAQNYTSPNQAASTTAAQLTSGNYPHLLEAFKAETWWQPGFAPDIYADLVTWGATRFAAWYKNFFGANFGSGGPPSRNISAPAALGGWKAIRKTVNRDMPQVLNDSQRKRRAALRHLSRARKVRL